LENSEFIKQYLLLPQHSVSRQTKRETFETNLEQTYVQLTGGKCQEDGELRAGKCQEDVEPIAGKCQEDGKLRAEK
jgi:hypothetical protein